MNDKNSYLGTGLQFPIEIDSYGRPKLISGVDLIRQSILHIINTTLTERFMLPEFGSNVEGMLFEQNNDILRNMLTKLIQSALINWEKRIKLTSITFGDAAIDTIQIQIQYRVLSTDELDSINYQFTRG